MTDGNLEKLAEHERQRDAECEADERGEAVFLDRFGPAVDKACTALLKIRDAVQALREAQHDVAQNGGSLDFIDAVRDWSLADFDNASIARVWLNWEFQLTAQAQDIAENMADEDQKIADGDDE